MTCDKNVLKHFYGDESGKGTRSKIINDIKAWAANNRGHRIIIGSHLIGKFQTINYSLKNLGVLYFPITEQTDMWLIDNIASRLIKYLFAIRDIEDDDIRELLVNKAKEVRTGKTLQDKYFLIKDLIKKVRSIEPRLSIIFIYKSKSKLETELYDAFVDNECQFIFKVNVDKNELSYDKSVTLDSIILEADDLDLWPLSVEESKKMIRGEHPEVNQGVCGITPDVVREFFPETEISVEDLIIKIVGCHPYLLSVLCGTIIDRINLHNSHRSHDLIQFLCNLIKKDCSRYDRFFKNFFCNIKEYRNDLFVAYRNWILKEVEPQEDHLDLMNMFGMIFEKNEELHIPFLFKEYIKAGTTKNFNIYNFLKNTISTTERRNTMGEVHQNIEVKEGRVNVAGRDIIIVNGVQNQANSGDIKIIKESKKKILILSANPIDTTQKRLDEEIREIGEGLRRAKQRDQFEIHPKFAVRIRDIRRALLDVEPHIVHFTGHGKEEGLWVEDELGNAVLISTKALSRLFKQFSGKVQCVILNSCYSAPQATAINKHIDYVVGMRKEINDESAIEFVVGFYDALGAGRSYEQAFELGLSAITDQSEDMIPLLKKKDSGKKK